MFFKKSLTILITSLLIIFSFRAQASPDIFPKSQYPLSDIAFKHKGGIKFGDLIKELESKVPTYDVKTPVLKNFLAIAPELKNSNGTRFLSCTEIIAFCKEQALLDYLCLPEESPAGYRATYAKAYGVEFSSHGPVDALVQEKMRNLLEEHDRVNYMDFGAGYGTFVHDLLKKFPDKDICADLSEVLSAQCYHAAEKLMDFPNVRLWPSSFFNRFALGYENQDRMYHLSTCLNVFHFMTESDVKSAIKRIYDVTEPGGWHLSVAYSAYTGRKDYPERPTGYTEDWGIMGSIDARSSFHFFKTDYLGYFFKESGFNVKQSGYFGNSEVNEREFCYIMVQKPTKIAADSDSELEDLDDF